jgi:flagellum-specific peptidoglycan hydrolase FlgJ
MASFSSIHKRIKVNIVQIYAPTNEASDEDKEEFYSRLQGVMEKLPAKDVNILMGDANAKVGSDNTGFEEVMGRHGIGEMNDNGERFASMCSFNRMVIGGTVFPHKRIHKATWVSPDGDTENQIDHFCISRKFRRSVQDVRVLRGADIGSDHHLLLAVLRLRLKRFQVSNGFKRPKYQVSLSLLGTGSKKEEFQISLKNKFQPLEVPEEADIETHWSRVKEAFTASCEEVLGRKEYKHKEWISQSSIDKVANRRMKKEAVNNSRTRAEKETARMEYRQVAKKVKKSIKEDKEKFVNELAERAEKAAQSGHTRVLYQTAKVLAGKGNSTSAPVKDVQRNTVFDKEAQNKRWMEHFETLLNRHLH